MSYATVLKIPQYFRNLHRLSEILRVMVKHGFGDLVQRLNLSSYLESGLKLVYPPLSANFSNKDFNTRVRLAFEELGPTFIKLGQLVATRPDIFPVSLTFELKALQDNVPAFSAEESKRLIEEELGRSIAELFSEFDEIPLAAASIAQVHRARLSSGEEVVVKVQRPNLGRILNTDIEILTGIASLIEENIPETRAWSPSVLVEEFSRSLKRECDFKREAQNAEIFAANFTDEPGLIVPEVFKHLSTKNILVEEFICGINVDQLTAEKNRSLDAKKVVETLNRIVLRSIFEHGFFHADPHPGNILITADNKIALIDFGSMGRLENTRLGQILQFLVALFSRDLNRIVRVLHETGIVPAQLDETLLKSRLSEIVDHYLAQPIEELDLARLVTDIFELTRRHGVKPPADLLLIAKSITTLQSIAHNIAPDYVPLQAIQPYLMERYLKLSTDPNLYATLLSDAADSYLRLLGDLPNDIRTIVRDLARGELRVKTDLNGLSEIQKHQNKILNRSLYGFFGIVLLTLSLTTLGYSSSDAHHNIGYLLLAAAIFVLFLTWRGIKKSGGI